MRHKQVHCLLRQALTTLLGKNSVYALIVRVTLRDDGGLPSKKVGHKRSPRTLVCTTPLFLIML